MKASRRASTLFVFSREVHHCLFFSLVCVCVCPVYGKPVLPSGSTPPSPLPFMLTGGPFPGLQGPAGEDTGDREGPDVDGAPDTPPPNVENIPRPLSPTKLTPMAHSPLRYQSDADLEMLRKKLANAPRPLKKRSSITEPEGPAGPNIQKLLYQRFNTLAGGMEGGGAGAGGVRAGSTPFYQPANPPDYPGDLLADADNGNPPCEDSLPPPPPAVAEGSSSEPLPPPDANDNKLLPPPPAPEVISPPAPEASEDTNNNNLGGVSVATLPSPVPEVSSPEEVATTPSQQVVRLSQNTHTATVCMFM